MNIEIEKKYKFQGEKEIIVRKLLSEGFELISETDTEDFYFIVPQKIKNTRYLRVRKDNNKDITLAYHEVIDNEKTKEWETEVKDYQITIKILSKLGFKKDVVVSKKRKKLLNKNKTVEVVIDEVDNLGNFIEIEAKNIEEINKISKVIDLKEQDLIKGVGYPDLLRGKNERTIK